MKDIILAVSALLCVQLLVGTVCGDLKVVYESTAAFEGIPTFQSTFKCQKELIDMGVFPVEMMTESSTLGRTTRNTMTLKSVSTEKLGDSLFEIPEGYTKKPIRGTD